VNFFDHTKTDQVNSLQGFVLAIMKNETVRWMLHLFLMSKKMLRIEAGGSSRCKYGKVV
jgi:hypothetical protein